MEQIINYLTNSNVSTKTSSTKRTNSTYCNCRSPPSKNDGGGAVEWKKVVEENPVVVFAQGGCCMSQVVRQLLRSVGANPITCDVEEQDAAELAAACGGGGKLSAVFVGGRWFGGTKRVIAMLIAEELGPLLKKDGAMWL